MKTWSPLFAVFFWKLQPHVLLGTLYTSSQDRTKSMIKKLVAKLSDRNKNS